MAAADGVFKCIYEGCIAGCDTAVERRPYHRNCGCALHKSGKAATNAAAHCGLPRTKSVSFPIRKSWSEGCLAFAGAASGSPAQSSPSPSSSPAVSAGRRSRRLGSCDEADEESGVFFRV